MMDNYDDMPVKNINNHVIIIDKVEDDLVTDESNNDILEEEQNNNKSTNTNNNDVQTDEIINNEVINDEIINDEINNNETNNIELLADDNYSNEDILNILSNKKWYEIGEFTFLAATFDTDGNFNIWDTVGNPCMKGIYSINTDNMTISFDCSTDQDFDPPFTIPKESVCRFSIMKEGYFSIQYQEYEFLFQME
jgi:hypothetical protein